MFSKRTVKTAKSAIVALLLTASDSGALFATREEAPLPAVAVVPEDGINADWVSSMTKNHWKLYKPTETLDMYSRAEYKM